MTQHWIRIAAATVAAILAASPLGASMPASAGTISIEQAATDSGVGRKFLDGIRDALAAHGFTILSDPGHSAYVAEVALSRTDVGTGSAKVAGERGTVVPGGIGGVGGNLILPLSSPKARSVAIERIRLELRIRKRSAAAVLWRGSAVTVRAAGTAQSTDEAIVADLSEAILRSYPDEPRGVISVP